MNQRAAGESAFQLKQDAEKLTTLLPFDQYNYGRGQLDATSAGPLSSVNASAAAVLLAGIETRARILRTHIERDAKRDEDAT